MVTIYTAASKWRFPRARVETSGRATKRGSSSNEEPLKGEKGARQALWERNPRTNKSRASEEEGEGSLSESTRKRFPLGGGPTTKRRNVIATEKQRQKTRGPICSGVACQKGNAPGRGERERKRFVWKRQRQGGRDAYVNEADNRRK